MSVAERIIKNTGWLYAKMGITMFVSLWVTRLVLNSLGQSDFGIFNLVGGAIAMLGFLNVALASATQRYMSYSQGEGNSEGVKTVFNVSLMMHIAISLFCGLLLLLMGFVFFRYVLVIPEGRETASIVVYASLVVSTMLTIISVPYDAALNAHENMRYYAFVGIFESLLKLCVAFACVLYGGDRLILYGVLMACIPLVSLSIMLFYC
ncbi:MAG: MATE family efflux transporter, partial [Bacteroidales bacterium]|nr:MATE family efflux transporter [Bacteroidales bacterium]